MTKQCAQCDKPVKARGLCNNHYTQQYLKDLQSGYRVKTRTWNDDPKERFLSQVDKKGPIPSTDLAQGLGACWLYRGNLNRDGYGLFKIKSKQISAHRFSYQEIGGLGIPEGLEIDHLCMVRNCVNPEHMEPVTRSENMRRAQAQKTHCPYGHLLSGDNLKTNKAGVRICRACANRRTAEWAARKKAAKMVTN